MRAVDQNACCRNTPELFFSHLALIAPTKSVTKPNRSLNPKKLLMSKWSAVEVRDKEKHFLVTRVINLEAPEHKINEVEMEAVMSRRGFTMRWQELLDATKWMQGWL
jgi:tryptophan-rich hypothetical protein